MDSVLSKSSGEVAAVKRAQIIQRVLVDGWSPAQTAAVFAVPERRIARWVEDYRRRGMASLRDEVPGERIHQRWLHALTGAVSRCYAGLRRGFGLESPRRASSCGAPKTGRPTTAPIWRNAPDLA